MDARRFLTFAALAATLGGCASLPFGREPEPVAPVVAEVVPVAVPAPSPPRPVGMAPIPNPPEPVRRGRRPAAAPASASTATVPAVTAAREAGVAAEAAGSTASPPSAPSISAVVLASSAAAPPAPAASPPPVGLSGRRRAAAARDAGPSGGRAIIAEANAQARATSAADAFENGVQVFAWEPGRLYEVWTAPLRVTTLTLAPGESVTAKAAGDTVRWQIGETTSGSGAAQRTHVLVKPLEAGLETNLVLTTSERVYMLQLRSGAGEGFNAAVAWRYPAAAAPLVLTPEPARTLLATRPDPERLDGGYRIDARAGLGGRRPRWTPTAAFNDGARTFITLPPETAFDEAPVLFVLAPNGEAQVVNYRQQGTVLIIDRVFDRAELRLGERRPQVVRIHRTGGGAR